MEVAWQASKDKANQNLHISLRPLPAITFSTFEITQMQSWIYAKCETHTIFLSCLRVGLYKLKNSGVLTYSSSSSWCLNHEKFLESSSVSLSW